MREYKLDCGHTVYSEVELRQQYSTDVHYILCPSCRKDKELDLYGRPPTAWRNVVGGTNLNDPLHNVLRGDEIILPNGIMRIQPSVPINRVRPFPYIRGIRR